MANTFKSQFTNLGTTADTNIYTTPVGVTTILKSIYASNADGSSSVNISISVGATGATAAYLIKDGIVPIQSTLQAITETLVLEAEDRINAQASSVNGIDIILSYMEIT